VEVSGGRQTCAARQRPTRRPTQRAAVPRSCARRPAGAGALLPDASARGCGAHQLTSRQHGDPSRGAGKQVAAASGRRQPATRSWSGEACAFFAGRQLSKLTAG